MMAICIGIMTGTSMDAVDLAAIRVGSASIEHIGQGLEVPFAAEMRETLMAAARRALQLRDDVGAGRRDDAHIGEALRAALESDGEMRRYEQRYTDAVADALIQFVRKEPIFDRQSAHDGKSGDSIIVGFHGQTVLHAPRTHRLTWQIGDGQRLADRLADAEGSVPGLAREAVVVVNNFRQNDVDNGGEGAPLVPLYHRALGMAAAGLLRDGGGGCSGDTIAVLNVGGVANVTVLDADTGDIVLAFDTGPGGSCVDDYVSQATGGRLSFDADGNFAALAVGGVDETMLAAMMDVPSVREYLSQPPPKSLDKSSISLETMRPFAPPSAGSEEPGAATTEASIGPAAASFIATLTAFTVECCHAGLTYHLREGRRMPKRILLTGGGRKNAFLMQRFAERFSPTSTVEAVEAVGWRGDTMEAECFAWLAYRSVHGLPLSVPATTGVARPVTGGLPYTPRPRAV